MTQAIGQPISVAILAGGRSRRMGRDKALLELDGRPLLQHVRDRVAVLTDDLLVVATDRPAYARFGLRVVPDRIPSGGALSGIHAALREARYPQCLVVGCDMPFLSPTLLTFMAGLPRDYDMLVPALDAAASDQGGDETLETLHAIYGKGCLAVIERRLAGGQLKIAALVRDLRVRRIPESVIRRYDPDLQSFVNVNTLDDIERARSGARVSVPIREHQSPGVGGGR